MNISQLRKADDFKVISNSTYTSGCIGLRAEYYTYETEYISELYAYGTPWSAIMSRTDDNNPYVDYYKPEKEVRGLAKLYCLGLGFKNTTADEVAIYATQKMLELIEPSYGQKHHYSYVFDYGTYGVRKEGNLFVLYKENYKNSPSAGCGFQTEDSVLYAVDNNGRVATKKAVALQKRAAWHKKVKDAIKKGLSEYDAKIFASAPCRWKWEFIDDINNQANRSIPKQAWEHLASMNSHKIFDCLAEEYGASIPSHITSIPRKTSFADLMAYFSYECENFARYEFEKKKRKKSGSYTMSDTHKNLLLSIKSEMENRSL